MGVSWINIYNKVVMLLKCIKPDNEQKSKEVLPQPLINTPFICYLDLPIVVIYDIYSHYLVLDQ